MGNCISCTDPSSHEQPESKIADGERRNQELQLSVGAMPSMRQDGISSTGACGGTESSSNGSRTPGGSSGHRIISLESSCGGTSSQKTEKKTFYSRIPPLGRSGSTDRKSSSISNTATIKDNNNAYSESKIAALFDRYKDPHEDLILAEGIEKMCKDLEVKPEDFKVLVLAWKFGAEQMCRFTREEFFQGMKELKTDTLQGIQARLPDVASEVMSDSVKFKDLYRYSFKFALDSDVGQRILPTDMAVSLWRVVFSQKEPEILNRWVDFLEAHPQIRGIPRDTWNMFLNFVVTVGSDLSTYDDTEAWPSLFDDFVEYENDKLNQNTISVFNSNSTSDKIDQQHYSIQQVIENSYSANNTSSSSAQSQYHLTNLQSTHQQNQTEVFNNPSSIPNQSPSNPRLSREFNMNCNSSGPGSQTGTH